MRQIRGRRDTCGRLAGGGVTRAADWLIALICVYMCEYVCICVYMCVYVCMCVNMCVYVCILVIYSQLSKSRPRGGAGYNIVI